MTDSFIPMYERSPSVVHLAVHPEKGLHIYFTAANVIALNPPATIPAAFFRLCQNNAFARTLLHSKVSYLHFGNMELNSSRINS